MSSVSASTAADRRTKPRVSVRHPGKLFLPDGSDLEVVIFDLSESGAAVLLRRMAPTPGEVVLADQITVMAHRASVVWSKDAQLGLKLTRSISLRGVVPGPLHAAKAWCLGEPNPTQPPAPPPQDVVHI